MWRKYAVTSVIGPDVRHFQLLLVFCIIFCRTIEIEVSVIIFWNSWRYPLHSKVDTC